MVWKSIIFTFCLIKSWLHDQSECTNIFRNLLKEVRDNMRPSYLYHNLHTPLRYHKNNYTVRTTQE